MKTTIAENLFTLDNFLSSDECDQLIARGEALGFEAATVATAAGPRMMTNVRNNDRATLDDADLTAWLWQRAQPHIPTPLGNAVAFGFNDHFKFYRYDPSQRFNAHRDGIVEISPTLRSRLTFMIYLNEGATGGQTIFYSEERVNGLRQIVATIEPKRGMALCFAHEWWHEGARVTEGRKYVLRTDVLYADIP
jgi:hypothetical protein